MFEELTPEILVIKYQEADPSIDESVLLGIHEIDWCQLPDAYGSACDIPAFLRAALSDNENDRNFAFQLLHETVWHQGTFYEVTANVIPFLHQMLLYPQTPDRASVALLISSLANGDSTTRN